MNDALDEGNFMTGSNSNGGRTDQRLTDFERRLGHVEDSVGRVETTVNGIALDFRTFLAVYTDREKRREEERDLEHREAHERERSSAAPRTLFDMPLKQAGAVLSALIFALLAALLQLLGIEVGG